MVPGPDDYTRRLHYHVERVKKSQPIYFPDIDAKISLISSADAASCLEALIDTGYSGPLNMASSQPVQLRQIMDAIESAVDKEANLSIKPSKDNQSPFGVKSDWYISVEKMTSLGIRLREPWTWLNPLIQEIVDTRGPVKQVRH